MHAGDHYVALVHIAGKWFEAELIRTRAVHIAREGRAGS